MPKLRIKRTADDIKENEEKIVRLRRVVNNVGSIKSFSEKFNKNKCWVGNLLNGINMIKEDWLQEVENATGS